MCPASATSKLALQDCTGAFAGISTDGKLFRLGFRTLARPEAQPIVGNRLVDCNSFSFLLRGLGRTD